MVSASEFIKKHPYLCACTLGLAVVGYMAFRMVEWIIHKCRRTQKIETVAQQILRPAPPKPTEKEIPVPKPTEKEIPVLENIHSYTGDLTSLQKADLQTEFSDDNTLKIYFTKSSNFAVTIRKQDLFASEAQVLVNAANTHLGGGEGIDGAIHTRGGKNYVEAHRALQKKYNKSYTRGYAAMLDSGALKTNHGIDQVIVVAGPEGENITPDKENALYSCYYNCLMLAESQKKTSIAFPSISTGIFLFPKEKAASIALKAIYDFITNSSPINLTTISIHFLPTNSKSDLEIYQTAAST